MPNRYEILSAIESLFLSIQNKINSVRNGSVIKSIFYSVASILEDIYDSIEEVKNNSYVHTAQGEYLDQLIYGLSKLERLQGSRALGYVTLSPVGFTIADSTSVSSLSRIVFSRLDLETGALYIPPFASTIKVSTTNGVFEYAVLPPMRLLQYVDDSFFEINPQTGNQKIAELLTNYAIALLQQKPNHVLKYIIIPLISIETGANKNLNTGTINAFITADKFKFLVENNFDYTLTNGAVKETVLDIDSITTINSDSVLLGINSEIIGGTDIESDESYRQRYWSFLGSLTKGTINSIKNKLSTLLLNSDVQIYQSTYPGIIDVYISSSNLISTSLPILVSQLEDVKPAGTIINLRVAKTNFFNVIFETREDISENDVEKLKKLVADNINALGIGEELNYSKIWQILSNNYNVYNLYFGFLLDAELFETYKYTFKDFICSMYYDKDNPSQLPDKCNLSNNYFTYAEYLNFVEQGKLAIYLYSKLRNFISYRTKFIINSNILNLQAPRYPERKLVENILNGVYENIINSPVVEYEDLIREIQYSCKNKPTDLCFRELSNSLFNKPLSHPLNSIERIGINIQMIESIDPISANYLKIKFLTAPIPSNNDIELCESLINDTDYCLGNSYEIKLLYSLLNDVQYIQYKDLDSFQKDKEVCKISSSNIINKEYAYKYNVGVRKV